MGDTRRGGVGRVAIACHQEALQIREKIGDHLGHACTLRALGRAYLAESNPHRAQEHLTQAMQEFRLLGDANGYVSCRLVLVLVPDPQTGTDPAVEAQAAFALFKRLPAGAAERMGGLQRCRKPSH